MKNSSPPALNFKYVCIAPSESPIVAALISNYFNEPGTYFPILVFPDVDQPYAERNESRDDAYIARVIGTHAAVVINNAIARLRPRKILLAGMNEIHKTYIYAYLPKDWCVEVNGIEDVDSALAFLHRTFDGTLLCRPSDVVQGLMISKYTNQQLRIDDREQTLDSKRIANNKGLIVIENEGGPQQLAAVNYAFSIGADVILVPAFDRPELHPVQQLIYEWKKSNSHSARIRLEEMASQRVGQIEFSKYDFATFFTTGFPYGLILNNVIPFTHVFTRPHCDLFILNNIGRELFPAPYGSALVFSPKLFNNEETDDVIEMLGQNNYYVKTLLGKAASVKALDNYGGHFPFDLMHICSHGGETTGYYVVQEFQDRNGKQHMVEFEEIVGFSPAGPDKVLVTRKLIFRRLDGFKWMSDDLKKQKIPDYVLVDMRKAFSLDRESAKTIRVTSNTPIYTSCHIECSDSIHQGLFHSIAGEGLPFIFNNTCSSWHEIAMTFIAAGATGYIGTIWKVGNAVAREAAKVFYKEVLATESVLNAFHDMNEFVKSTEYQNIYIYWGFHFCNLKTPKGKSDQIVFNALMGSLGRWVKKYNTTKDAEVKRNCIPILNFISHEIKKNFSASHLAQLHAEIDAELRNRMNSIPPDESPRDDLRERGVIDL
jgi:hypothetical protein